MRYTIGAFVLSLIYCGHVLAAPFAYVGSCDTNNVVLVIDLSLNSVVDSVNFEACPTGFAVSPDGKFVYTANVPNPAASVSAIDTSTNTITANVEYPAADTIALAVSPNNDFVYVSTENSSSQLSVIRTSDHKIVKTLDNLGAVSQGVAVTPDGKFVYMVTGFNEVTVIKTSANPDDIAVVTTINVLNPMGNFANCQAMGVTANPDSNTVYVTCVSSTLVVIDVSTNTVSKFLQIMNPDRPDGQTEPYTAVVTPDGKSVYVTDVLGGKLFEIQTSDNTVVDMVNVGKLPSGVDVTPDGSNVYVLNADESTISVVQTSNNQVVDTLNILAEAFGRFITQGDTLLGAEPNPGGPTGNTSSCNSSSLAAPRATDNPLLILLFIPTMIIFRKLLRRIAK